MSASPSSLSTRGVLGYLPGHPDLVRVRGGHRVVRSLEQWLERGLHQARWELGSAFPSAYARLVYRFLFRVDNSDQIVAGVLYASEDSHGRPFPFVAFELLPTGEWDRDPLTVLERSEAFFSDLDVLVRDLVPLRHIGQVHGRVLAAGQPLSAVLPVVSLGRSPTDPDPQLARELERYQNFLDETCLRDLVLDPSRDALSALGDLEWLLRGAGRDPRSLRVGLQLSLVRPPRARPLELRFYTDLVLRLAESSALPTVSLFFRPGEGGPGSVVLCFREPSFELFSALLRPEQPHRAAYVPGRGQPGPFGTPPSPLGTLSPDTPLSELTRVLFAPPPSASPGGGGIAGALRAAFGKAQGADGSDLRGAP